MAATAIAVTLYDVTPADMGKLRWRGTTKAQRSAHAKMMVTAREAKREMDRKAEAAS